MGGGSYETIGIMTQYLIFIALAPVGISISIGIAIFAWRRRTVPAARELAWCAVVSSGWLICNTLEVLDPTETGTLSWAKITYVFIVFAPVMWLRFALAYTGRQQWLTPRRTWIVLAIPILTCIAVATNDTNHLIWQNYTISQETDLTPLHVDTYGWWFWIHVLYSYFLVLVGVVLIGRTYVRALALYRQQAKWAVLGAALPIATNLLYVSHVIPWIEKDYSPLAWTLGCFAFAIAIFRYHLLDLMPVARQALVDCMAEGMLILDKADHIVEINRGAQALIGLRPDEAVGRPVADVWQAWRAIAEPLARVGDAPVDVDLQKAGLRRWYEVRTSTLPDKTGHPAGRLVLVLDVTRRKEMEEKLRESNLELQARNSELDAFAHLAAHDLKRPLTAIVGYSELLECKLESTRNADPLLKDYALIIGRTGQKMSSIVNALLFLAGVRKQEIVTEPMDIAAIVAAAREDLESMATARGAEISQPATWPSAMGYAQWIEAVWVNLISNAIKYGGDPPRVALGADLFTDPVTGQPKIRSWVRDNGPGLTPEQRSQLFTAFARLHPEQADGHGLGLFLVRRIIDKLGGQVDVETAPGEGSRFYFDLPAVVLPDSVSRNPLHGSPLDQLTGSTLPE
jgi:PAS domain S-box-containing protein